MGIWEMEKVRITHLQGNLVYNFFITQIGNKKSQERLNDYAQSHVASKQQREV